MSNDYNPDDYNRGGKIAFLFSMAFCIVFFIYISFMHQGVDLRELPPEAALVDAPPPSVDGPATDPATETPFDPTGVTEPWVSTDQLAQYGARLFGQYCAMCHGPQGLGDGPAARGLIPPPRNLVTGRWRRGGTPQEHFVTVTDGLGQGMPGFGQSLTVTDRWAIVHYVRSITQDRPEYDAAELEQFARGKN
jgi:mono/diheme cytochrome c family protein